MGLSSSGYLIHFLLWACSPSQMRQMWCLHRQKCLRVFISQIFKLWLATSIHITLNSWKTAIALVHTKHAILPIRSSCRRKNQGCQQIPRHSLLFNPPGDRNQLSGPGLSGLSLLVLITVCSAGLSCCLWACMIMRDLAAVCSKPPELLETGEIKFQLSND